MPLTDLTALLDRPSGLPVAAGLAELTAAVHTHRTAVLQSPPGSGKTTLVPPALAVALDGPVIVTQPRRIAVRAAARRLAQLLGQQVGAVSGYSVRGERQVGRGALVEFVTPGLLLRRLQRDPELPGIRAVVLDEVHERQVDSDLLLAMLGEVRATLREDLVLVAMSATVEAERVAAALGEHSPVVTVPGALHPVEVTWAPPPSGTARLAPTGTTAAFLDHVAATVRRAARVHDGDVLVFLPGAREVDDVVRRLRDLPTVLPLHGRLPTADQDRALQQAPGRRVVVSTAVAESSLTVPGVRVVVDAGLARVPRTDHERGLSGLVTRNVSRDAAEQRAGRAGREGPGAVYRCWSAGEHAAFAPHVTPEILTADLTSPLLQLARWGTPRGEGLGLLDPPPPAAVESAEEVLRAIGAVDELGEITTRGRTIADAGTDPRLARALLDAAPLVGAQRAAEIVALLADPAGSTEVDLPAALRRRRSAGGGAWRREVARWRRLVSETPGHESPPLDLAVGLVTALAHPGRIARRRPDSDQYLLAGGTGARLTGSALAGSEWLAVAEATRAPGQVDALVRAAAPIDEATAREAGAGLVRTQEEVTWRGGRLHARTVTRLGAIELTATPLDRPSTPAVAAALQDGLREEGLNLVAWSSSALRLRERLAFLHAALGDPWPDVSDDALLEDVVSWLGPDLARVRSGRDLRRVDTTGALRRLLPWPQAGRLDELAPDRITVPTGSAVRVDYTDPGRPTLSVRIQEVFGWRGAPALAGGRVPLVLELLSPARRPAAVTADLAGFWRTGYPAVRAELRGRYPKHPWPEDPAAASPTTRTKARERR